MEPSSFPKFARLPTELRLNIGEAACFHVKSTRSYRGLHYVNVQNNQVAGPLASKWPVFPGLVAVGNAIPWAYPFWPRC